MKNGGYVPALLIHGDSNQRCAYRNLGAAERLRPKFMTVATMFVGLILIIWATGTGSDVWKQRRADGWRHLYLIRLPTRRRPGDLRNLEVALRAESRPGQAAAPLPRRPAVARRRRRDNVSGIRKRRV